MSALPTLYAETTPLELDLDRLGAMRDYMLCRRRGMTPKEAVQASAYAPAEHWFHTDSWELAYRAVTTTAMLDDEAMSSERELLAAKKRRLQVAGIVDRLHDQATDPQADVHEKMAAQGQFLRYASALDTMDEAVEKSRKRASMRFNEQSALPRWVAERRRIEEALRGAYQGKGPQYEVLCERLASSMVLLKIMETASVAMDVGEYQRMNAVVLSMTNQLQKFTEATKTQAISTQINDALARLMGVIEEIVAPANPMLWKKVVDEITRRVNGIVTGDVPQMLLLPEYLTQEEGDDDAADEPDEQSEPDDPDEPDDPEDE